ncbi:expressed unknown protein [Ectocarpus siliculosus]|uniref:Uncharacterized protein n=1 Tax=Ectocarpus siliculosus TaxID=2880 RepID=D7G0B7_ECTSI|nr:expressed unknown protein [Ectocarpus siliculosus]|eukprot:CBJ26644.1 expressed unknown protein [Ectocarpus siliculosus]
MTTAAFTRPRSPRSVAKLHGLASNVEDRKKSRAHSSQDTNAQLRKFRAGLISHTKNTDNHDRHRRLQTCAEGSGVTVTSSMFPLLEGCLVETDLIEGGEAEFVGETGMIAAVLNSDDVDAEYIWAAYHGETSLTIACFSLEPVTSAHPSTATWYCVDDTTEDGIVAATDTTFGVDCGCDDDDTAPTPTVTTTPAPDVDSTTPTAPSGSSCSEGESFTVDISALPEADGCYLSTGYTLSDEHVYTQTGGVGGAEMWIHSLPSSDDDDAVIYWYLAYVPEITSSSAFDGELAYYCGSFEPADTVHPADANWVCTFASSSTQTFGADGASFTCGCSSGPTPEATEPPLPEPTPEPTEPPLPDPTPEPTDPLPEPTPEPVLATPEPASPTPDPVSTTPEPVSTTPEPTILTTPEPVAPTPDPVSTTPEPVSTTPEPTVLTTPEPVAPTPDPVSTTPEPVSTTPEPTVSTTPGQVAPAPVSEAVTPTSEPVPSVAPTPDPAAESQGLPPTQGPTSTPTSAISGGTPSPTLEPIDFPDVVHAPSSPPEIAPSSPTCGDTESFQIISSELPDIQGCFQATSTLFSTPESTEEYWSLTGEAEFESILVGSILDEDTEEEGDSTPWYLIFLSEDDDATVLYCYSNEQGILVHPADATWRCDLDGTGVYSDVTAEEVSFTCGCTGTPAPAPGPIATPESPAGTSPPIEPESDDGGILGRRLSTSALVAGATSVLAIGLALGMGV